MYIQKSFDTRVAGCFKIKKITNALLREGFSLNDGVWGVPHDGNTFKIQSMQNNELISTISSSKLDVITKENDPEYFL